MATISINGTIFAFISSNKMVVHHYGSDSKAQILQCEKPVGKETEKKIEKSQGNEVGEDKILAFGISCGGKYLVACDDYKQIWIWTQLENQVWTLHSKRDLGRRCTSLTFTKDEQTVLVADKSGDVFSFSLVDKDTEGQLLLGHISMLLDVTLCGRDDNFVVTCDRDEKIRVSHYPNAYNIQSYCLGHTEFVSRLGYFEEDDLLISGGGDCVLKIWNYRTGTELFNLDLTLDSDIVTCTSADQAMEVAPCDDDTTENGKKDDIMSRTESIADVKCMACCQRNKFLTVGFNKQNCLLLYKLDTTTNPGKPMLVKRQKIQLSSDQVWDVGFDQWDNLWYLESVRDRICHILRYDQSKDLYIPLVECNELTESRDLLSIANDINSQQQELFKSCFDVKSGFELLHKVKIDNMSDYMERKQNRIEEKLTKRKKKNDNTEDSETVEKLPKVSS